MLSALKHQVRVIELIDQNRDGPSPEMVKSVALVNTASPKLEATASSKSPSGTETFQKNVKDWEILQLDPRGETPCFANRHMSPEYASYNPPRGYTAEEIMQFQGAKEVFRSVEEVQELLALRDKHGSLEEQVVNPGHE
ncbi:hypothetical protein C0991_008697 [Blastosporella zonata]|nr:hypothetical protein C0991_008697 [Blastosporella zonata]